MPWRVDSSIGRHPILSEFSPSKLGKALQERPQNATRLVHVMRRHAALEQWRNSATATVQRWKGTARRHAVQSLMFREGVEFGKPVVITCIAHGLIDPDWMTALFLPSLSTNLLQTAEASLSRVYLLKIVRTNWNLPRIYLWFLPSKLGLRRPARAQCRLLPCGCTRQGHVAMGENLQQGPWECTGVLCFRNFREHEASQRRSRVPAVCICRSFGFGHVGPQRALRDAHLTTCRSSRRRLGRTTLKPQEPEPHQAVARSPLYLGFLRTVTVWVFVETVTRSRKVKMFGGVQKSAKNTWLNCSVNRRNW